MDLLESMLLSSIRAAGSFEPMAMGNCPRRARIPCIVLARNCTTKCSSSFHALPCGPNVGLHCKLKESRQRWRSGRPATNQCTCRCGAPNFQWQIIPAPTGGNSSTPGLDWHCIQAKLLAGITHSHRMSPACLPVLLCAPSGSEQDFGAPGPSEIPHNFPGRILHNDQL